MSPTESTQDATLISALREAFLDEVEASVRALDFDAPHVLDAVRATVRREHDERAGLSGRRGFAQAQDLTASRISLVHEDELSFSLDLTNLTRSLREHCGAELVRLHVGYAALLGRPEIAADELPVGPAAVAQALRALADAAGLSSDQRADLVDRAGETLGERLRQFYIALDQRLNQAGVKTERIYSPRPVRTPVDTAAAVAPEIETPDPVTALEARLSTKAPATRRAAELDPALVQGILRQIREWLAEKQNAATLEVQLTASGLTALLPSAVATAIEAIERIFGVLASNPDLAAAPRQMIGRLQIPMLRLVLDDPESIADHDHPARQLINTLARLGIQLPQETAESDVVRSLDEIVTALQNDPEPNREAFAAALHRAQTLARSCSEDWQQATSPFVDSADKLDRREHALQTASGAIARITAGGIVPAPIHDFLWTWWVQVLARTLYRLGNQHPRWREQVNAAHQLVLSARPIHAPQERNRRTEMLPSLLQQLREGLAAVGTDGAACERSLRPCMEVHAALLAGGRAPDPAIRAADPQPRLERIPNKPPALLGVGQVLLEHGRTEAEVLALAPGDVLEIRIADERPLRANVTWVGPLKHVALLVDQADGGVIAASLVALGRLHREHRVRRLGATDVVDEAATSLLEAGAD